MNETQTPQMICDLETNIVQWAREKGINDPYKQCLKFVEEAGEMTGAMLKGHKENFVEEAGDVLVTLAILLNQNGTSFSVAMQAGWDKIKDRKGKTVNGTFIKVSDLVMDSLRGIEDVKGFEHVQPKFYMYNRDENE